MQCTMSAESADTCVVNRVFDHAAPDRVMHIRVTGLYGDCTCTADELIIQLNRIGEYCVVHGLTVIHGYRKYITLLNLRRYPHTTVHTDNKTKSHWNLFNPAKQKRF